MEITVGVDLASQPASTAIATIEWGGGARITELHSDVDDGELLAALRRRLSVTGVDVPLGWPDAFIAATQRHHHGEDFGDEQVQALVHRATDRWVWKESMHRLRPLSVSTDRIAYPAMRMARLLGQLEARVDRSGGDGVVEVYPAVALKAWGLNFRRYKRSKGREELRDVVGVLRAAVPWLQADDSTWRLAVDDDNAFDAVICALVARAHALGQTHPVPDDLRDAARREGWIAVPSRTLSELRG